MKTKSLMFFQTHKTEYNSVYLKDLRIY